jgi:hypothetical protein
MIRVSRPEGCAMLVSPTPPSVEIHPAYRHAGNDASVFVLSCDFCFGGCTTLVSHSPPPLRKLNFMSRMWVRTWLEPSSSAGSTHLLAPRHPLILFSPVDKTSV